MPLVPAICTQCGALLEVDSLKEAAVCSHCNTPFVTEKAIHNYNVSNVTQIQNLQADSVILNDTTSIENRIRAGETFLKLEDFQAASETFQKLTQECPYDYRGWWGRLRAETENFKGYMNHSSDFNLICEFYENVKKTADHNSLAEIALLFDKYQQYWNDYYNRITNEKNLELSCCDKEYNQKFEDLYLNKEELKKELDREEKRYNKRLIIYFVSAGIIFSVILGYPFWKSLPIDNYEIYCLKYGGPVLIIFGIISEKLVIANRRESGRLMTKLGELDRMYENLKEEQVKKRKEIEQKYSWL